MNTPGKFFLLLISCFYGWSDNAQAQQITPAKDNAYPFSLSFSTFNHAERIFDGTTTYHLNNRQLTVKKRFFLSAIDTILFTRRVTARFLKQLRSIQLDTLKDFYVNYCVMVSSGNEYAISTDKSGITKTIWLHHYYLKEIDNLATVINRVVPKKYKIKYLDDEPDNYCDWKRLQTIMCDTTAH
jgi:hypothetical protein